MIQLRPYQDKAIEDIRSFFYRNGLHAILQAPTGTGKTVIFTYLSKLVSEKGNKILILTDRSELLYQTDGALNKIGLKSFFIQAGCKTISNDFQIFVAMSQTLRNRINLPYWIEFLKSINLFIIDEAHKQEFNYLFESGLVNDKHVIGFTATPRRTGKMRHLALDYEKIIDTLSVKQAINEGYLVNDDYFGFESPDMSKVQIDTMKGDYMERQMFKMFDNPKTYRGAFKNYMDICPGTKTLIFCVNIEHVIKTCIEFQNNGLDARFLVSEVNIPKPIKETDSDGKKTVFDEKMAKYNLYKSNLHLTGDRRQIIKDFAANKFPILVNAGIATTGFDDPSIETIIILRATLSTTLWLQMIGRGSRPSNNKTHFNILDFGGNAQRLGYYSELRTWSLWHERYEGHGLPPIKECGFTNTGKLIAGNKKGCRRLILAAYKICPFCGFIYPEKVGKEINLSQIVFDDSLRIGVPAKRIKDMSNQELYDYWKLKGHKSAWLWRQLFMKSGSKAILDFGNEYKWQSSTIDKAIQFCSNF
jgi:superfamily II DNA or RNA helicase